MGIIADNPGVDKSEAFRILREKHLDCWMLFTHVKSYCFACQSADDYCADNGRVLPCKYCPLDWGSECCVDNGTAFEDWNNAMNATGHRLFIQTCAEKIADLPLRKNAYELYNIKESPDE